MRILTDVEERVLRLANTAEEIVFLTEDEITALASLVLARRIILIIRIDNEETTEGSVELTELGKLALKLLPALKSLST